MHPKKIIKLGNTKRKQTDKFVGFHISDVDFRMIEMYCLATSQSRSKVLRKLIVNGTHCFDSMESLAKQAANTYQFIWDIEKQKENGMSLQDYLATLLVELQSRNIDVIYCHSIISKIN